MHHSVTLSGAMPAPIPTDPYGLLTTPQLQHLLGVTRITVYRWVKAGVLPPPDMVVSGARRRKMWKRSTIEHWIDSQRRTSSDT